VSVSSAASTNYKWLVLVMTSIGMFMTPLDSTIVSISLPAIASSLRLDYATLIWVPTAYLVPLTVLPLTIGRLSDIYGNDKLPVQLYSFAVRKFGSYEEVQAAAQQLHRHGLAKVPRKWYKGPEGRNVGQEIRLTERGRKFVEMEEIKRGQSCPSAAKEALRQ
jgi:hypothetical protein